MTELRARLAELHEKAEGDHTCQREHEEMCDACEAHSMRGIEAVSALPVLLAALDQAETFVKDMGCYFGDEKMDMAQSCYRCKTLAALRDGEVKS